MLLMLLFIFVLASSLCCYFSDALALIMKLWRGVKSVQHIRNATIIHHQKNSAATLKKNLFISLDWGQI